jgi:hypothetical protein
MPIIYKQHSFAKDDLIAISQLFRFLSRKNIEQIRVGNSPELSDGGRLQTLQYRNSIDSTHNRNSKLKDFLF